METGLAETLKARQTIRHFSLDVPDRQEIEQIIEAGLLAPYALAGTRHDQCFRRFFVLTQGSETRQMINGRLQTYARRITAVTGKKGARSLLRVWDSLHGVKLTPADYKEMHQLLTQHVANTGHFRYMTDAPYYIIVAEKNRVTPLARHLLRQSLAHCLQNMWLMATEKGLAFQLISLTEILNRDRQVCAQLGIRPRAYELDGCLIGYPAKTVKPKSRHYQLGDHIQWI